MMKKCILLFLLVWCVTVHAEMVNRYSFDDGAIDSINAKDGTLTNTAVVEGGKLILDGESAVELPSDILDPGLTAVTIEAWFQDDATGNNWSRLFDFGETVNGGGGNAMFCVPQQNGTTRFTVATNGAPTWQTGEETVSGPIHPGEMTHVACVWDGDAAEIKIYINGALEESIATTMDLSAVARDNAFIGDSSYTGDPYFTGSIDEFRIYDTALTDDEVLASFNDGPDVTLATDMQAKKPNPKNGAEDVSIDVGALSWAPGSSADTHDVFFGTDANLADAIVYAGLDVNSVDIARLAYDTTYYWRVDEVNAPSNPGTYTGKVWSFTTEPEGIALTFDNIDDVSAYTPVIVSDEQEPNMTCNESGLDANDLHSAEINTMWLGYSEDPEDLVWIQYEFDQVYKFFELLVWNYNEGFPSQEYGARDVSITYSVDGENWEELDNVPEFQIATGEDGYAANNVVDMNNAVAKYIKLTFLSSWTDDVYTGGLSEIRFFVIPNRATVPDPENGAENIGIDQILGWKEGRGAASHTVYVGSDANDVRDGIADIVQSTEEASLEIPLDLATTYYWKVDEVNDAEDYTTWDGPVWSFSTVETITVEDFEDGYDTADANAVWMTWSDGYYDENNGAEIGKELSAPGLSEENHNGDYSAPVYYANTGSVNYSEVTANSLDLPIATEDWTKGSPETLVIWFSGDPNNDQTQMYAKLNNTKVLYEDDPIYLTKSAWRPFVINLSDVSADFSDLTSITIGFEKLGSQDETGTVLIDDIALYGVGIAPQNAEPVEPGTEGLIASYLMESNLQDSSGNGLNGTAVGTPTFVDGIDGYGKALELEGGDSNDCVDLGLSEPNEGFNPEGSFSVSLWAKISDWSTGWGNVMVGNRGESGVGWQVRRGADDHLCFTTRGIGTNQDDTYSDVDSPPLNEWVHITCVYDSEEYTKSIYINGILDNKVELNGENKTIAATTHNTYIGARATGDNSGFDSFFTGQLDQIYIYGRALSAGEAVYLSDPTP